MEIFVKNVDWMGFNTLLALVSVVFGWGFYKARNTFLKFLFIFIWLAFLPNTLYLFTDIIHFAEDYEFLSGAYIYLVFLMYVALLIIGVFTFVLSEYPIEQYLRKLKNKSSFVVLILINFLVGFGIVLGWLERANSWEVLTSPVAVLRSVLSIITSVEMIVIAIFYGVYANLIYFVFRDWIVNLLKINRR